MQSITQSSPTPPSPFALVARKGRGVAPKKFSPSITPKLKRTRAATKKAQVTTKSGSTKSGPKPQAIKNKIKSAQRDNYIVMEETDGGIVLTLQAGFYEIFKAVFVIFYSNPGTVLAGRAFKFGTPRENNITHTTSLSVHSNDQSYTINFYHSQSKVLVNGKDQAQFKFDFNLFIAFIRSQQAVGGIPVDAKVNELLRLHLEAALEDQTPESPLHCTSQQQRGQVQVTQPGNTGPASGTLRLEGASGNDNQAQKAIAHHVIPDNASQSSQQLASVKSSNANSIMLAQEENNLIIDDIANVIKPDSSSQSLHTQVHIPDRKAILQSPNGPPLDTLTSAPSDETPIRDISPLTRNTESPIHHGLESQSSASSAVSTHTGPLQPASSHSEQMNKRQHRTSRSKQNHGTGAQLEDHTALLSQEPSRDQGTIQNKSNNTSTNAEMLSRLTANQHRVQHPPDHVIDISTEAPTGRHSENHPPPLAITGSPSKPDKIGNKQRNRGNKAGDEEKLDPADLRKRENSLRKKEEALKQREKRTEQVERDLADARAQIVMQEARIKDLEASNRLLNQQILAIKDNGNVQQAPPMMQPTHNHIYGASSDHTQYQPFQHPQTLPFSSPNNTQIMHQMELMQQQLKHNQEINDLKQSIVLDKLANLQNMQSPPVYNYPALPPSYQYVQATRQPTWWGSTPVAPAIPTYAVQTIMGANAPSGAKPAYTSYANRYIPNPKAESQDAPPLRAQPQNISPRDQPREQHMKSQPKTKSSSQASNSEPREPQHQTDGNIEKQAAESTNLPSGTRPKSFLQATGPTNHKTNNQTHQPSTSEPTTSRM